MWRRVVEVGVERGEGREEERTRDKLGVIGVVAGWVDY